MPRPPEAVLKPARTQGQREQPSRWPGKQIVYLDQCALSNLVKAKDAFWRRTYEQLKRLVSDGHLLCPVSPLHREESLRTRDIRLRESLHTLSEELSGGWEFRSLEEVERLELLQALRDYLREPGPTAEGAGKDLREQGSAAFVAETARWIDDYAQGLLSACRQSGPGTEPSAGQGVDLVPQLAAQVQDSRPLEADPGVLLAAFLTSDRLRQVPFLRIAGSVQTALAEQSRGDKSRRRARPSDRFDVAMLSHYAPYCHAVFLDNEFRKIASQRNIDVPGRFGVRLFSESSRAAFADYLDGVASGRGV